MDVRGTVAGAWRPPRPRLAARAPRRSRMAERNDGTAVSPRTDSSDVTPDSTTPPDGGCDDGCWPRLDSLYPVTQEQITAFRRDGHVLLPSVLSRQELHSYSAIIHNIALGVWRGQGLEPVETSAALDKSGNGDSRGGDGNTEFSTDKRRPGGLSDGGRDSGGGAAGGGAMRRHFLQTLNLRHRHPAIMRFVLARRFGGIVAQLTGCHAMRIFHEQ